MRKYLIIFSLLMTESTQAQFEGLSNRTEVDYRKHITYTRMLGKDQQSSKGVFYPSDEFVSGTILIGKEFRSVYMMMRYNKLHDVIEIMPNDKEFEIRPTDGATGILMGEIMLVSREFVSKGVAKIGFFEVLEEGSAVLLTKEIFRPGVPTLSEEANSDHVSTNYVKVGSSYLNVPSGKTSESIFNQENFDRHYYYEDQNGTLHKVDKLKKLIQTLPDNQTELKGFAEKNSLLNDENGLKKLIAFYNSLQEL